MQGETHNRRGLLREKTESYVKSIDHKNISVLLHFAINYSKEVLGLYVFLALGNTT